MDLLRTDHDLTLIQINWYKKFTSVAVRRRS